MRVRTSRGRSENAPRNRKYYPIDTGLRRSAVTPQGEDFGKHLECATFLALRRKYGVVHNWRGKGEVDFVVLEGGRPRPIQVSAEGPLERHMRALDAFYEEHHDAHEGLHIFWDEFEAL